MYGFCRITDLGKSHFNFSSKNYSSKVYTCFAGFFYDLILNLQVAAETHQRVKNHLARRPLELLNLTNLPSVLAARPSSPQIPIGVPSAA
jgi:hypothetical protein